MWKLFKKKELSQKEVFKLNYYLNKEIRPILFGVNKYTFEQHSFYINLLVYCQLRLNGEKKEFVSKYSYDLNDSKFRFNIRVTIQRFKLGEFLFKSEEYLYLLSPSIVFKLFRRKKKYSYYIWYDTLNGPTESIRREMYYKSMKDIKRLIGRDAYDFYEENLKSDKS